MIAPYDHEALWMKAKVFLNRAMGARRFCGLLASRSLTGWSGGVCLVVTVLFRRVLWSDDMACPR